MTAAQIADHAKEHAAVIKGSQLEAREKADDHPEKNNCSEQQEYPLGMCHFLVFRCHFDKVPLDLILGCCLMQIRNRGGQRRGVFSANKSGIIIICI